MHKNIFDLGYEIKYQPKRNGYAELSRFGSAPILEFYKAKVELKYWYERGNREMWFFKEATLNDDPLNELLPPDWQVRKFRGFFTMREVKDWLQGL